MDGWYNYRINLNQTSMENNAFKTILWVVLGLAIVGIAVFLLTKDKKTGDGENMVIGMADVNSIDILKAESFPVQVNVVAKGDLPDGCTTLGDAKQVYDGKSDFTITLETKRPIDATCTQALVPFEKTISLSAANGLAKGTYTVSVNGIMKTFTLETDNFVSQTDPLK